MKDCQVRWEGVQPSRWCEEDAQCVSPTNTCVLPWHEEEAIFAACSPQEKHDPLRCPRNNLCQLAAEGSGSFRCCRYEGYYHAFLYDVLRETCRCHDGASSYIVLGFGEKTDIHGYEAGVGAWEGEYRGLQEGRDWRWCGGRRQGKTKE